MADKRVFLCAGGCGRHTPDPAAFDKRGVVSERLYCPECVSVADEFLSDRDALHTYLAKAWQQGLAELVNKHKFEGGELPDV